MFYDTLRYTEIREFNLVSFDSVLSQLGGIVGLWLGFSVYTVIEIIDMLWQWHERSQKQQQRHQWAPSALEMPNQQNFNETSNNQLCNRQ